MEEFITKLFREEPIILENLSDELKEVMAPYMEPHSNQPLWIDYDTFLSVQASYFHYCSPRATLPLGSYQSMEVGIMKENELVTVDKLTKDKELIEAFKQHYSSPVYSYVPVELIERLYQDIKKHHGFIL